MQENNKNKKPVYRTSSKSRPAGNLGKGFKKAKGTISAVGTGTLNATNKLKNSAKKAKVSAKSKYASKNSNGVKSKHAASKSTASKNKANNTVASKNIKSASVASKNKTNPSAANKKVPSNHIASSTSAEKNTEYKQASKNHVKKFIENRFSKISKPNKSSSKGAVAQILKWRRLALLFILISVVVFIALLLCISSIETLRASNYELDDKVKQLESQVEYINNTQVKSANYKIEVSPSNIKAIPDSSKVQSFGINQYTDVANQINVSSGLAPVIKTSNLTEINKNIDSIKNKGAMVGFLFMDLSTGQGLSYNLDSTMYGASTIKAPYCTAVCQNLIDTGQVSMSNYITSYDDNYNSTGHNTVQDCITQTIRSSSNGNYSALRQAFLSSVNFGAWLENAGIGNTSRFTKQQNDFASFSAREASLMWLQIYKYLISNSQCCEFMQNNFANTNVSFIRDACSSTPELSNSIVWNKAGWVAEGEDFNTSSDFGVLRIGDNDYLCVFASTLPDLSEADDNILDHLIASVLKCKEDFN